MSAVLDDLYARRDERDSLDERIKRAEWEAEVETDRRERQASEARVNYEKSIEGYTEAQDDLLATAQALIEQHEALRLHRERIEAAHRNATRLGVGARIPPRIAIRISAREEGIDHYLVSKLKAIPLGDV